MPVDCWFSEMQTDHVRISCRVTAVLHREKSPYQEIAVYETVEFGRLLALDDVIQTTERDEFTYHEAMAHPALCTHPRPRRVLVVGGGDGGVLREVLKHPTVEEAHLVEIDERVMAVARQFLPGIAAGFDDPRAVIHVDDGIEFVARHEDAFDVIIVDSTDPVGPAVGLFEEPFYRSVHRALGEDGVFVAQTESPFFNAALVGRVHATLRRLFPVVRLLLGMVPTYPGGYWSMTLASKGPDPSSFDEERAARLETRYYSPEVHRALLAVPPFVRRLLDEQGR